eukprot:1009027-Prymnesium_polylepis.1
MLPIITRSRTVLRFTRRTTCKNHQNTPYEEVEPSTDQHDSENEGNPEGQPLDDTQNEDGVMKAVDAAAV